MSIRIRIRASIRISISVRVSIHISAEAEDVNFHMQFIAVGLLSNSPEVAHINQKTLGILWCITDAALGKSRRAKWRTSFKQS